MAIAILGWGSLIWCPGNLRIRGPWRHDGPVLPIEFARISADGRLTLVVHRSTSITSPGIVALLTGYLPTCGSLSWRGYATNEQSTQ